MKKTLKSILAIIAVLFIISAVTVPAFAANEEKETTAVSTEAENSKDSEAEISKAKAIAAAIAIAIVAAAGAIGMAIAIKSASDGMARQPEAAGSIRSNVMLGLVFIETAIIYALIVAILIIFVL